MRYYAGIDLGARNCAVCVIDDDLRIVIKEDKVRNELSGIIKLLEPYEETLQIVVESTFNWYWLIDGLQASGYDACLAHTLGLYMITGAKVKTDPRDAFSLAKLLRIGAIPKGYIYPKESRPIRDLLRRRLRLVNRRAGEYASMCRLLLREGIVDVRRHQMRYPLDEDLQEWFKHPIVQLYARQEVARIGLYSTQITELEQMISKAVSGNAGYERLKTVPGIGQILAWTIYYEIGDIGRFKDRRQFCSYCRLIPGVAQSGQSVRRGRGRKQGNPYLKWAFTQAAVHAVQGYPKIRKCYQRQAQRHRGRFAKLIANNIIAHKLGQAAYQVLRCGTEYQEELLFGK
jgi:transposase